VTNYSRPNDDGVDHIPDTYRDDLLREVALMKSIGQHRNIVSMVGACTARRPIALIMEYVPYGNLQNFLKFVLFTLLFRFANDLCVLGDLMLIINCASF